MLRQRFFIFAAFTNIFLSAVCLINGQSKTKDNYIRDRLSTELYVGSYTENLSNLFQIGDSKIDELIKYLDDSDEKARYNAQLVIRYLGNQKGMDAVISKYLSNKKHSPVPPIPLPLREPDYNFIETNYLKKDIRKSIIFEEYLYALCLDRTGRSREVFESLVKKIKANKFKIDRNKYKNTANVVLTVPDESQLASSCLQHSIFISEQERILARTSLLAVNSNKSKALIEIYVNGGPLATKTYHVVLEKMNETWRFYSISLVLIS